MSSTLKTTLTAGAIALAVGIFAVQAAHAGGRHYRLPLVPFNNYAAGADAYDDDSADYAPQRSLRESSDVDEAVSAARALAREYLDNEFGEALDSIGE